MHGPPRSPARRLALLQGLVSLLLLPTLVVGSLDLHSSDLPHGVFDGPSEILPDARHPLAPAHLEASTSIHIPSCSACLLQLKSSGGVMILPERDPVPVVAEAQSAAEVDAPAGAPGLSLRSRAPPAA